MSKYIVQTHSLSKKHGDTFNVNNIDLKVKEGEIYGFLGPNGAGKTTTIKMLLGLVKPTNGEIKIFGQDLKTNRLNILKKLVLLLNLLLIMDI